MDRLRRITMTSDGDGAVVATNRSGATIAIDPSGETGFTPVELLLAALGSCGAVDVALLMRKQRDPVGAMRIEVEGEKDDARMTWLRVRYHLEGEHDPAKVDRALTKTSEDLCSVSRTIRMSAPVEHVVEP
ncbi:MAG: OsmC family protein [Actinomycetota bacterium]